MVAEVGDCFAVQWTQKLMHHSGTDTEGQPILTNDGTWCGEEPSEHQLIYLLI